MAPHDILELGPINNPPIQELDQFLDIGLPGELAAAAALDYADELALVALEPLEDRLAQIAMTYFNQPTFPSEFAKRIDAAARSISYWETYSGAKVN
jgi:hypothetical protein